MNYSGQDKEELLEIKQLLKEVQAGKYRLKEVKAPAGYVLDEMPKTIEVKAGETLELEIPNKPMRGQIQIVKTAAENNTITRDKAADNRWTPSYIYILFSAYRLLGAYSSVMWASSFGLPRLRLTSSVWIFSIVWPPFKNKKRKYNKTDPSKNAVVRSMYLRKNMCSIYSSIQKY